MKEFTEMNGFTMYADLHGVDDEERVFLPPYVGMEAVITDGQVAAEGIVEWNESEKRFVVRIDWDKVIHL